MLSPNVAPFICFEAAIIFICTLETADLLFFEMLVEFAAVRLLPTDVCAYKLLEINWYLHKNLLRRSSV